MDEHYPPSGKIKDLEMNELLNQTYQLNNPPCISEVIDNDAVVINLDNGHYFHLDQLSGYIWNLLCEGYKPLCILKKLKSKEPLEKLELTLTNFIKELLKDELLIEAPDCQRVLSSDVFIDNEFSLSFQCYHDMKDLLALDPIHDSDETIGWPKERNPELA